MDPQLLITRIRDGAYDDKELRQLRENCLQRNAGQEVLDAIELRMRLHHPAAATRLFGARQDGATALLQKESERLERTYDLSRNRHERHVKTGGDEQTGARSVYRYISYCNDARQVVELSLRQNTPASSLQACVTRYVAGQRQAGNERSFAMGRFDEAVVLYEELLRDLLQPT